MDRKLRSREKESRSYSDTETLESSLTDEHTSEMTSKAMEAFLEAQTRFLDQQQKFAADEEARKHEMHLAQIKELEERGKLLKLQEEQTEETRAQRAAGSSSS